MSPTASRTVARLAVAALAAALVACGDDEGPRLSTEDFREQANEICSTSNEAITEAGAELSASGEEPSEDDLESFRDLAVDEVGDQLDELDGLNPPEDLEADFDAFLEDARAALEEVEDADVSDLFEGEDPFAETYEQATELGLDACAE